MQFVETVFVSGTTSKPPFCKFMPEGQSGPGLPRQFLITVGPSTSETHAIRLRREAKGLKFVGFCISSLLLYRRPSPNVTAPRVGLLRWALLGLSGWAACGRGDLAVLCGILTFQTCHHGGDRRQGLGPLLFHFFYAKHQERKEHRNFFCLCIVGATKSQDKGRRRTAVGNTFAWIIAAQET